ncbi:MAG: flagellar M-ring protein FliF, partial [Rhodospirillales bacterium]|nr:flagellar M-ring protein FliF [Rhodospirillales bacterium]
AAVAGEAQAAALLAGRGGALAALPAPEGGAGADESMVSVAQIEGQMRASSIRRISDMAERHPEETLSILRGWMAREAG